MNYELRIKLLIVAVLAATTGVSAQKYPERRETRQGTRLYDRGDYAGAETGYRRALELNPELREAGFNLGNALWRKEMVQEAADAWMAVANDSLADGGMISAASYNVGNAALAGQQLDAAIEAYKQALRLRPDDMDAKFNLAYAQKMQQKEQNKDENEQNDDQKNSNDDDKSQNQESEDNNDDKNDKNGQNDQNDQNDRDGDGNNDPQNGDGDEPPPPSGQGRGEAKIDPRAAEQMLDAMQAAEDDTREKVDAKEVQVGARSGKNW